jgi:hypothetical protein
MVTAPNGDDENVSRSKYKKNTPSNSSSDEWH